MLSTGSLVRPARSRALRVDDGSLTWEGVAVGEQLPMRTCCVLVCPAAASRAARWCNVFVATGAKGGYEELVSLPVVVEAIALEPLRRGERETTLVRAQGAGHEGLGEDVTRNAADRASFRRLELEGLRRPSLLCAALATLSGLPLADATTHSVVANYRRWAIESSLIDLTLRQAGLPFGEVLGLSAQPVRFVVSPRECEMGAIRGLLARGPGLRLKLDPRSSWTRSRIDELAGLGAVDILDLKGTYPGTSVYQPPDARLYGDLVEAFPEAWLEDPALVSETVEVLRPSRDRIAWDEPIHVAADLDRLQPLAAVNVKPSRLGSLAAVLETVACCRRRGVALYGGGQSEIGPGRGQIQLLASLLYADGPNDVAPMGYDDLASGVELASRPLVPTATQPGFR